MEAKLDCTRNHGLLMLILIWAGSWICFSLQLFLRWFQEESERSRVFRPLEIPNAPAGLPRKEGFVMEPLFPVSPDPLVILLSCWIVIYIYICDFASEIVILHRYVSLLEGIYSGLIRPQSEWSGVWQYYCKVKIQQFQIGQYPCIDLIDCFW